MLVCAVIIENRDLLLQKKLSELDRKTRIGIMAAHIAMAIPFLALGLIVRDMGLKGMFFGGATVASLSGLGWNIGLRVEQWYKSLHPR